MPWKLFFQMYANFPPTEECPFLNNCHEKLHCNLTVHPSIKIQGGIHSLGNIRETDGQLGHTQNASTKQVLP